MKEEVFLNPHLEITTNADELKAYLNDVNNDFTPPLNTIVDIDSYATKLINSGTVLVAVQSSAVCKCKIMGILGGYFNMPKQGYAFISIFHVRQVWRRLGVGAKLMQYASNISKAKGFKTIKLMVNKDNDQAISAYKKYGYTISSAIDSQFEMVARV